MTTITLYNTRTRAKEVFQPLDWRDESVAAKDRRVRMYVCGPTVYDRAHLGNARPVIVFDVLYRLLRHVYGAGQVTYARNITDVDDKIIDRAAERGIAIEELTATTTGWFHADMARLGVDYTDKREHPHFFEPKATDFIAQMQAMIAELIAKGHAYEAEWHVLFRVRSYEQYGTLSGRSVDDMIAGARVEVAPYKEDPMDFVLWKPSGDDLPGWESPWGRGRPGWHIECSAMSRELLGENFDIHGGGNDLLFPHHENEIAQSVCAHPGSGFAQVWMHNEMLQVDGKKMAKSLGNFFTVRDLLDGRGPGGVRVPGEVIRFVMLSTHYRKPMDWTERKVAEAEATLREWWALVSDCEAEVPDQRIVEALADDLNTPLALSHLHSIRNEVVHGGLSRGMMLGSLQLLGQLNFKPTVGSVAWGEHSEDVHAGALALARKWMELRKGKNYSAADDLRDRASKLGVELQVVNKDGRQQGLAKLNREVTLGELEALK